MNPLNPLPLGNITSAATSAPSLPQEPLTSPSFSHTPPPGIGNPNCSAALPGRATLGREVPLPDPPAGGLCHFQKKCSKGKLENVYCFIDVFVQKETSWKFFFKHLQTSSNIHAPPLAARGPPRRRRPARSACRSPMERGPRGERRSQNRSLPKRCSGSKEASTLKTRGFYENLQDMQVFEIVCLI